MSDLTTVMENVSLPVGELGWAIPILGNGRFIITAELDIIDTNTNGKWIRDKSIPLSLSAFNIPDLTNGQMTVAYLFALAVKPLLGLTETQLNTGNDIKVQFLNDGLNKPTLVAKDVFWQMPNDGIEIATGRKYMPGFSRYYMETTNGIIIREVDGDTVMTAGDNRGTMYMLIDDFGGFREIDARALALIAHGKYDSTNYDGDLYQYDGDDSNLEISNLKRVPTTYENGSDTIQDPAGDRLLGN